MQDITNIKVHMERMQTDIEYIKKAVDKIEKNLCKKADQKEVDSLKKKVYKLNKFRWQALAIGAALLWFIERVVDKF